MKNKEALLVINAGSSSIKFALYSVSKTSLHTKISGKISNIGQLAKLNVVDCAGKDLSYGSGFDFDTSAVHEDYITWLLNWLHHNDNGFTLIGVGHRVVHGGREFISATKVSESILVKLRALTSLAPLHQPHNLLAINAVFRSAPNLPQVACFDTSFHHTQVPLAKLFAIPQKYADDGVLRYGFHGLSYEYIASQLPKHLPGLADGRVVVAHLGNGASMCALKQRQSVATSMGFTALDGLMMGQRCGSLDAGVVMHFMRHYKMSAQEVEHLLYYESGLLGVSGISNNMKTLQGLVDNPQAQLAIDLFCFRAAQALGSLLSTIGGLDAIVFTGGIGENSALVREKICEQLTWLGLGIDTHANYENATTISQANSSVKVLVLPTNEELVIAQSTQALLCP
jgi:acetate kinase